MDQAAADAPGRRGADRQGLHEIKCDCYRMRAWIDGDQVKLLTGLLPFEERQEGSTLVAVQSQASA